MLYFPPFIKHDAIGWQKADKCWKTFLARKTKPNKQTKWKTHFLLADKSQHAPLQQPYNN